MGSSMNRLEKRGDELYRRGVLQVCLDVHMTTRGSMERSDHEQERDVSLLRTVLETWEVSNIDFDTCVLKLVVCTIDEFMTATASGKK